MSGLKGNCHVQIRSVNLTGATKNALQKDANVISLSLFLSSHQHVMVDIGENNIHCEYLCLRILKST